MSETLLKEINLPNIVKCLNSKIYFPCHPRPHQKIFMEVLRSLDSFFTDTEYRVLEILTFKVIYNQDYFEIYKIKNAFILKILLSIIKMLEDLQK